MNKHNITLLFLFLVNFSFAQITENFYQEQYHKKEFKLKGKVKSFHLKEYKPVGIEATEKEFSLKEAYFFDKKGRVSAYQDYDDGMVGEKRVYEYHKNDSIARQIVKTTDNTNYTITYKYNSEHKLIEENYSNSSDKKLLVYDRKGNLIKKGLLSDANNVPDFIEEFEYDDKGNVIYNSYPDAKFGYKYDKKGRKVERIRYAPASGKIVFFRIIYEYNSDNKLVKERICYGDCRDSRIHTYKNGKLIKSLYIENESNTIVVYSYNKNGDIAEEYTEYYSIDYSNWNNSEEHCMELEESVKDKYSYDKHHNYIRKESISKNKKIVTKRITEYY